MVANSPIKLIVGLGNPGAKYTQTRHNAGFWFLDRLAQHYGVSFREESKFKTEVAAVDLPSHRLWLIKPTTFMNLSGEALGPFAKYYQIEPENTLVVHDELDLPTGVSRLKRAGGHGGHNGLRDIFKHYSKDFWRLRIGIGHPGHKDQVLTFVMKSPAAKERKMVDDSIEQVLDTFNDVLAGDHEAAMRVLHVK